MSTSDEPVPVLSVTVTGADPEGRAVAATTVVQGPGPAVPAEAVPGTQESGASFPGLDLVATGGMDIRVPEEVLAAAQAEAPVVMAQDAQIPGMTNGKGHNSAVPTYKPPLVTQAARSVNLFNRTGGFR